MSNSWDPTIVILKETVIELMNEQFSNIPIKKLNKIGEGFDNTVFNLNDEILLRFPRREVAVSILKTEQKLLPFIKEFIEMKTTIPFLFGKPTEKFSWPFLGYNYIKGKTPISLSIDERLKMIEPLATFLKQLHSIPFHTLKQLDLPKDELRRLDTGYRIPQLQKYAEQAISYKLIPSERKLRQFIEQFSVIQSNTPLVLVHGDLHFKNIIVNDTNELEGVIDWGDAHIGQRELDLSIVYSIIPKDSRNDFYTIYGELSEESKQLAKFKAVYTTVLLLLFAHDHKEYDLVTFCQENLMNAICE